MPTRSSRSSVIRWPDATAVHTAVAAWARQVGEQRPEVRRIGYFGSYARGDWGVGSDLDIVVVVAQADQPFERRGAAWDATRLPVPADVLVYTIAEWQTAIVGASSRFGETLRRETVWVYVAADADRS